jgi:hypothetical protein
LTPQDYIDIKMLSARYAQIIEHCTNRGYDYAALYTPDGEFGGTNDWDVPPKRVSKGPDQLAAAANGGPAGCGDPAKWMGTGLTHIIVNTVITPGVSRPAGWCFTRAAPRRISPPRRRRRNDAPLTLCRGALQRLKTTLSDSR